MTKLKLDPNTPLHEASQHVFDNLEKGITCPCCDQFCKLYKRKLNSGMARSLIWLVQQSKRNVDQGRDPGGWVHLGKEAPAWLLRTKELATLRHWELVQRAPKDPENTQVRTSGIWRPTQLGLDFVLRVKTVPKRVHLYANNVVGFSPEHTDIIEALGEDFNYYELMAA